MWSLVLVMNAVLLQLSKAHIKIALELSERETKHDSKSITIRYNLTRFGQEYKLICFHLFTKRETFFRLLTWIENLHRVVVK